MRGLVGEKPKLFFEELNGFLNHLKMNMTKLFKLGYVESVLIDGASRAKEVSTP